MKMLHVITTLEKGGAEKQLVILARKQRSLGLQVCVAALKGSLELRDDFERANVKVIDDLRNIGFLRQITALRNIIKKEDIDLLHLHLPRAEILGNLASLSLKTKLIATRHNTEKFFPAAPTLLSSILSRLTSFRFAAVIAISQSVKNFLLLKNEVSPRKKLPVILYGFDEEISQTLRPRSLSSSTKLEKFVTLSRLAPQKDLTTMIQGLVIYRNRFGYGQLEIYGDGPLKQSLVDFADSQNVAPYIFFRGRTANVAEVLRKNQVFLLTSKYEGFGLVLLEAMQQSIPIICSKNSAIEEVMGDAYPFYFQTSNPESLAQCMAALQDLTTFSASSRFGIERLRKFDPLVTAEKTIDVYHGKCEAEKQNKRRGG